MLSNTLLLSLLNYANEAENTNTDAPSEKRARLVASTVADAPSNLMAIHSTLLNILMSSDLTKIPQPENNLSSNYFHGKAYSLGTIEKKVFLSLVFPRQCGN